MLVTLGERLKKARLEAGMSQELVASVLGVTRQAVGSWEKGKTEPNVDALRKLSRLYRVDPGWLLVGDENDTPSPDDDILRIASKAHAAVLLKEKAQYWEDQLRKLIERAKADLEADIPSEARIALDEMKGEKRSEDNSPPTAENEDK